MPLDGLQLGHYRLLRPIGSGGMGEVYLAEDSNIQRQVAIKVIRSEVSPYPNSTAVREAARLFQREARAIASLDHPNILPLYDYGEEVVNGALLTYLVTPFRQEGSLASWLQRRNEADRLLSRQDVAHIVAQAASALQYAHDHGVVHQDVKPTNFLIRANPTDPDRPTVLLADFGVAKISSGTSSASQSIRGTPTYMAPEQWAGEAGSATDQYALAVMAYELLVGRPPFQGSPMRMMYLHVNELPPPPSTFNARLSPDIDSVLLHALAKKPAERFASIAAFARAFEQAAFGSADLSTIGGTASGVDNADIRATLAISPEEARQGTSRTLTLPGGRRISVNVPAGVQSGQILRLEGVSTPSDAGSAGALLLTISITDVEEESDTVRSEQPDRPTSSITRAPTIRSDWHEVPLPASPAVTPFFGQGGPLAGNTFPPTVQASAGQPALTPAPTNAQEQLILQSAPPSYAPPAVPGYRGVGTPPPLAPYQGLAIAAPRRRSNAGGKILLMLLVLLLITGSVGAFFYFSRTSSGPGTGDGGGGTATAQAATDTANTAATNTAITDLNNSTTVTAQANNTATAQANAANATATVANQGNSNGITPVASPAPTGASTPGQQTGAAPSGSPVAPTAAGILSNLQIASAVNSDYVPTTLTKTFKPQQKVYATFLINTQGQKGYAGVKWYIDGTFGKGSNLAIDPSFNHGYFAISYNVVAQGAVEIYWCTQSNCSDEQLAGFATFTVSNTASTRPAAQSALAVRDMDRRKS
ncbi:MAG: protein kinase [Ktedonobacteraceae bacterium]|nr:protein kinase [Ktedonobacteraceae bacterium]